MTLADNPVSFYLAHLNDSHSHFESSPVSLMLEGAEEAVSVNCGGYSRVAHFVRQARQRADNEQRSLLLLHAGDSFQGSMYFSCFKGAANADVLNLLAPDAMTIGNHELDLGNKALVEFARSVDFPLLAANMDISQECPHKADQLTGLPNLVAFNNPAHPQRYLVKEVAGQAIAIFGVTVDNMTEIAEPDSDTHFLDVTETTRSLVTQIHRAGIRRIILLSHLGFARDCRLAEEVDGLSLIVGGHSHTLQGDFSNLGIQADSDYGVVVNDTGIFHSGSFTTTVGLMKVTLDEQGKLVGYQGGNTLLVDKANPFTSPFNQQQQVLDYLEQQANVAVIDSATDIDSLLKQKYQDKISHYQQDVIAHLEKPLRHIRVPDRQGGSEVAPLIAQAFLRETRHMGHDADFAIINGGCARVSLSAGPITAADIAGRLLPFALELNCYRLYGRVLRDVLEQAINNSVLMGGTGSFPYPANLDFEYRACADTGRRIVKLRILNAHGQWDEVQDDKLYAGVSTAYMTAGKDGFTPLLNREGELVDVGLIVAESFIRYMGKTQSPEGSEVTASFVRDSDKIESIKTVQI